MKGALSIKYQLGFDAAMRTLVVLALLLFSFFLGTRSSSPYEWFGRDAFDDIMTMYNNADGTKCHYQDSEELTLPPETVSMLPQSNQLLDVNTRVFRNRTCLLTLHDLALSRGYFFSYIFKVVNETDEFWKQPGMQYYYWRLSSFITAFPGCVNASSVEFDYNVTYPNWLTQVPFNTTIELFAPRATRNYNFMANRFSAIGPSMNRVHINDIGVGIYRNYTDSKSRSSHVRYSKWMPDFDTGSDARKGSYTVAVKYSDEPGKWIDDSFKAHTFFGPPLTRLQDNINLPVVFTQPYFDCGGRNVWMVSAVCPVVDSFPRYRKWEDIIEYGETPNRFVAVATMDVDWDMIDINPCPLGAGNPAPNVFAGTARCKPTTMCQPLHGWGFARGSYECVCRPGYRYPHWQEGPYQGATIEMATEAEYERGFYCLKIDNMRVVPSIQKSEYSDTYNSSNIFNTRSKREVTDTVSSKTSNEDGAVTDNNIGMKKHHDKKKEFAKSRINEDIIDAITSAAAKKVVKPRHKVHFKKKTSTYKVKKTVSKPRQKTSFKDVKPSDEYLRGIYGKTKLNELKSKQKNTIDNNTTRSRKRRDFVDDAAVDRMEQMFQHIRKVNEALDCKALPISDLILSGEVAYGVKEQFEGQGRTALALSHFLSSYFQLVDRFETFGKIKGDKLLNVELLHGEVLSHVMADHKIRGLGIWFDEDQYAEPVGGDGASTRPRRFFAPYAFQYDDQYRSVDMAGDPNIGGYTRTRWFRKVKSRWISNTDGLVTYAPAGRVRSDTDGLMPSMKFLPYPSKYKAAPYEQGLWTPPYYSCTGYVNDWVVTYVTPFFGSDKFDQTAVQFRGVVTVDVKLEFLDINQCPGPVYMVNAFKDTARCDYQSTYCVPIEGKRFQRGSYRCECKQGFEYPFQENAWFYDGAMMEAEWTKKMNGVFSKFDHLKCRPAGASSVASSWRIIFGLISAVYFYFYV